MEKLYGLIGEKLGHTYSPNIHKVILKEINQEGHYGLFEVKKNNLKYVVKGLMALGYSGINITIPYKTDLIQYIDELSPEAEKIGAINVIDFDRDGKSTGYNTDYYGFGMMLKAAGIATHNESAAILGTGGASRAVTEYLKDNGIKDITIVTRDIKTSKIKYPDENLITYSELNSIKEYSSIINCTPIGMYPDISLSPLDKKLFSKFNTAIDLIYNPADTLFLKEAKDYGLKTINGFYMLVAQAVKSQEIWNNIDISELTINKIISNLKDKI